MQQSGVPPPPYSHVSHGGIGCASDLKLMKHSIALLQFTNDKELRRHVRVCTWGRSGEDIADSSIKIEPVVTQQDTVCKASWTVLLVYVDLASCLGIALYNLRRSSNNPTTLSLHKLFHCMYVRMFTIHIHYSSHNMQDAAHTRNSRAHFTMEASWPHSTARTHTGAQRSSA